MNPFALSSLVWLSMALASGPQTTHTFSTPGTKAVTLRVCNAQGCSTITKTLIVKDPKPAILARSIPALVGSSEPQAPLSATLAGRPPLLSQWTLTGPQRTTTLTGATAAWAPSELGSHLVRLQVSNTAGLAFAGPVQLSVVPSTFADVSPTSYAWTSIEALAANGITSGCATTPPLFCPGEAMTRASAAVQLSRALSSQPLPPASGVFADVPPGHWAAREVEQLYRLGITAGCSAAPRLFCPDQTLTRAQAAVLILRTKYGAAYVPPPAGGRFQDVPAWLPAAPFIEQLAREGVTSGCSASPPLFCPDVTADRAVMAVFLTRALSLTPRPRPTLFQAVLCDAVSCTFPAGLPLQFSLSVEGGIPAAFEYDWAGDGIFEETSPYPVSFHTYVSAGTYRPALRVRYGSSSATLAHRPITVHPLSVPAVPPAPTGLRARYAGVQAPTRSDPPGTLWRTAFAFQANASRHRGFLVYLSYGGGAYRPAAVLPADLSMNLLIPFLPTGASASVYLVAFNDFGPSPASPALALTLP